MRTLLILICTVTTSSVSFAGSSCKELINIELGQYSFGTFDSPKVKKSETNVGVLYRDYLKTSSLLFKKYYSRYHISRCRNMDTVSSCEDVRKWKEREFRLNHGYSPSADYEYTCSKMVSWCKDQLTDPAPSRSIDSIRTEFEKKGLALVKLGAGSFFYWGYDVLGDDPNTGNTIPLAIPDFEDGVAERVEKVVVFQGTGSNSDKKIRIFYDKTGAMIGYDRALRDGVLASPVTLVTDSGTGCEIVQKGLSQVFCEKLPDAKSIIDDKPEAFRNLVREHMADFKPTVQGFVSATAQCDKYRKFIPRLGTKNSSKSSNGAP